MQKHDVEFKQIEQTSGKEFSDCFYRNCMFCEKLIRITPLNFNSCGNIGKHQYCPFCLRHNFHFRNNHNVLVFSFRAIIGYYYHRLYRGENSKMWVSELEEILNRHELIGLHNPTFAYDASTLLWFADFNKIGTTSGKAPFDEIKQTVRKMYDVFNIEKILMPHVDVSMWDKFNKAFDLFYKQRKRPKDRRMLIPTFSQSGVSDEDDVFYEKTRVFTSNSLIVK